MYFKTFTITLAAASAVHGAALPRRSRESSCSRYTIIDTRGNGTPQGPSVGFRTMNANILRQVSGGATYNTVYPAGMNLNSAPGTNDIVRYIHDTLEDHPDECFVLEGYSLGATATTNALPRLTGDEFDAVKAVFLIGNPEHRSGLSCNVDILGGASTRNSNGILSAQGSVPDNWVSKTMDVCAYGDGVCDPTHGIGVNAAHLSYPASISTQTMGTRFVVTKLQNARSQYGDDSRDDRVDTSDYDENKNDSNRDDYDPAEERREYENRREDEARQEDRRVEAEGRDDNSRDENDSTPPPAAAPAATSAMGNMGSMLTNWGRLFQPTQG